MQQFTPFRVNGAMIRRLACAPGPVRCARPRRHLILMVKEPRPGRVKTRLAAEIGTVAASRWFRLQTLALIRRLRDPRWQLILAVTPDSAGLTSRIWPAHLPRMAQGTGDLGDRMARCLRNAPPGPVLICGTDIAELERRHIARAFAALGHAPSVLGPAEDGGYWAVGLKRVAAVPPGLFRGVRWSTPHAMADTRLTLPAPTVLADTLKDIDTGADLRAHLTKSRREARGAAGS